MMSSISLFKVAFVCFVCICVWVHTLQCVYMCVRAHATVCVYMCVRAHYSVCICVCVCTLQCVLVEVRGQVLRLHLLLLHGFQDRTHFAKHRSTYHDLLIENAFYFSENCRGLRDLSKLAECSCHCVIDRATIRI